MRINSSATFIGNGSLIIGDDVWIGAKCHVSPVGTSVITIGSHIDIGPDVMLITGSHKIEPDGNHIGGEGVAQSITIGNGCWLGARSTILPGVSLAERHSLRQVQLCRKALKLLTRLWRVFLRWLRSN